MYYFDNDMLKIFPDLKDNPDIPKTRGRGGILPDFAGRNFCILRTQST
jgi:hypothetical protein